MASYLSHSIEETSKIAGEWLEFVSRKADLTQATIVGLSGHLGAGKTAFVKAVAKHLGVSEEITSPTFVIMKIYLTELPAPVSYKRWKRLIHIDAYRLEKGRELEVLGFEKLVADPDNLIMIEWIGYVKEIMPVDYITISFEDIGGNKKIVWEQESPSE